MAITRILPNLLHFQEFYGGYHGTCGEDALSTAMVCSTPEIETKEQAITLMLALTKDLISNHLAQASGATTLAQLRQAAIDRGFEIDERVDIPYNENLDIEALHTLLLNYVGAVPMVLQVIEAGNLHSLEGSNDEPSVKSHFIMPGGLNPSGYICNDGDNAGIEAHLVTYPWAVLKAAHPVGVFGLKMRSASVSQTPAQAFSAYQAAHAPSAKQLAMGQYGADGSWFAAYDNGLVLYFKVGDAAARADLSGYVATALFQLMRQAQTDLSNAHVTLGKAVAEADAAAQAAEAKAQEDEAKIAQLVSSLDAAAQQSARDKDGIAALDAQVRDLTNAASAHANASDQNAASADAALAELNALKSALQSLLSFSTDPTPANTPVETPVVPAAPAPEVEAPAAPSAAPSAAPDDTPSGDPAGESAPATPAE